ncbi:hypothetical protein N7456_003670 [Penicillium angulare]|uniref:tRNA wybutosine-synthesizing protein 2 n=1 Tax=Penicillium angulare TaxID=116970 RepID=A0A9W9KHR9_9EURO|nr:hypothetical protein N7456_003670 [Penicillium angulare]
MSQRDRKAGMRPDRREKEAPPKFHALQAGIKEFLDTPESQALLASLDINTETLKDALPKRFTIYEPLALLPANVFTAPPAWGTFNAALSSQQRESLYASMAKSFKRLSATHIAMNAPITPTNNKGSENRMRSPAGLIPLYGDFQVPSSASNLGDEHAQPSAEDLKAAFWVRTIQNHGIVQIWAPLYTMFSRGNVSEKARILGQGPSEGMFQGLDKSSLQGQSLSDISVVDMYAGIGYFVFSYLKRGVKRVWGWELNGWSVEGLRRGCEANKWGCKVVRILENGQLKIPVEELVDTLTDFDRAVVFHGDNRFAADILGEIQSRMQKSETWRPIRHVNLGLLPSSQPSWDNACRVLDSQQGGWLHVHENVAVQEIEEKKEAIMAELGSLRSNAHRQNNTLENLRVECCHVERVKTYAPGVMHCVFDIALS